MSKAELSLERAKFVRLLAVLAILLVAAGVGVQLAKFLLGVDDPRGLLGLLSLNYEANLPAFFSALLLALAALLLAVIATLVGKLKQPDQSKWRLLSLGFLVMSVDEATSIHERSIEPLRALLGRDDLGVLYFSWIVPGNLIVLGLGLFFLGFIRRLPASTRLAVIVAATLYLGGAIGAEMLGGAYAESNGERNLTYAMLTSVEEGLEMAGLIVFVSALLGYLADSFGEVRFRFVRRAAAGSNSISDSTLSDRNAG